MKSGVQIVEQMSRSSEVWWYREVNCEVVGMFVEAVPVLGVDMWISSLTATNKANSADTLIVLFLVLFPSVLRLTYSLEFKNHAKFQIIIQHFHDH
jgi:hypothetical protein